MRKRHQILSVGCLVGGLIVGAVHAAAKDWPGFRGPTGVGVTDEKNVPTTWDAKGTNVLWKTEVPKSDSPYSSPIVVGDRIYLTSSRDTTPKTHTVLCYAKADGKQLWSTDVPPGPWKAGRQSGNPTPCSDGERIYVVFGTAVIAAFDPDGKIAWRQELKSYDFDVSMGSSPILHGPNVLLLCDQTKNNSTLTAFDRKTGQIAWESARPEAGFAHSTPVRAKVNGQEQLLVMASKGLQGIDPSNGKVLWQTAGSGDTASPTVSGDRVYADGGRGGPGVCVDLSKDPTLPDAKAKKPGYPTREPKWSTGKLSEGLGSPIIASGYVYRLMSGDRLKCWKLETGEEAFSDKLPQASSWSSPIVTPEGLIYFASGGKSYILKAGLTLEIVATNDLGDANHASPAVADGKLYIRGAKYLWCIGK